MNEKIKILLVEPNKVARFIEMEDDLKAMQHIVGGYIAEYFPFDDDAVIVCNDEGKLDGLPLNRAIYADAPMEEVSYFELKNRMRDCEKEGRRHLVGYVVFTKDSFEKEYTEEERTYVFSSANKAFMPNMGGYSIYASSLDGSDRNVRIEQYMKDEYGGEDGWKIEKCFVKDEEKREMIEIISGTFFICRAPIDSENFTSLTEKQQEKYMEMFKYPERFFRDGDKIVAVPFKPKERNLER